MSYGVTYRIEGLGRLIRSLNKMGKQLKPIVEQATWKSGFEIERAVKNNPRTPYDTGHMLRSIRTKTGKMKVEVAPHTRNPNYAIYVHEGTRHMEARPFMVWGIGIAVPKIKQHFRKALRQIMKL